MPAVCMRTLDDWLNYISGTHPNNIDLGLTRVKTVFDKMNVQHTAKQVVVVSGTNGKGSTVALIEAGIQSVAGTVGVYTSPHITNYNERIRINGVPVSDEKIIQSFERIERSRERVELTYFEFGTLAALDVLLSSNLDVVVLEVGLGGRLDAVNIIDSDLSIITSVALDHTDWLGSSLEKIGYEKAGILRHKTTLLAGENLPDSVFQHAVSLDCPVLTVGSELGLMGDSSSSQVYFNHKGERCVFGKPPTLRIPLNNILLAYQALALLFEKLKITALFDYHNLSKAFESTYIPGRLEKLDLAQEIYLDVGHNPHAANYLKSFLEELRAAGKLIQVVYSSLDDKDVGALVSIVAPVVDCWLLAPLVNERALPLANLETLVGERAENVLSFETVSKAIDYAMLQHNPNIDNASSENELITLIFGSFYIIEAAKKHFEGV